MSHPNNRRTANTTPSTHGIPQHPPHSYGQPPYVQGNYGQPPHAQSNYSQRGHSHGNYGQPGYPQGNLTPGASQIHLQASASRGLGASLGIDPFVAFAMCVVDSMLFAGEAATGTAALILTVPIGLALTIPCILLQRYSFKDNWGAAIGKGMMVGVLTAIPFAIGTAPIAGMGVLGWRTKKRMQQ